MEAERYYCVTVERLKSPLGGTSCLPLLMVNYAPNSHSYLHQQCNAYLLILEAKMTAGLRLYNERDADFLP